ncbi:hypothetical protein CBS101457_003073 [Exobasidium rhododendri]|nr:hypothetical protein CBS101457_003073 [Exobasidium rhododendri]
MTLAQPLITTRALAGHDEETFLEKRCIGGLFCKAKKKEDKESQVDIWMKEIEKQKAQNPDRHSSMGSSAAHFTSDTIPLEGPSTGYYTTGSAITASSSQFRLHRGGGSSRVLTKAANKA